MNKRTVITCLLAVSYVFCAVSGVAKPQKFERYQPYENLLEVVGEFYRHQDDDLYLYQPAVDISGKNIYKATILRLDNFRRLSPGMLRAPIHCIEAMAFERLRLYSKAIYHYYKAKQVDGLFSHKAARAIAILRRFSKIKGLDLPGSSLEHALSGFELQLSSWRQLHESLPKGVYKNLALIELEETEMALCDFVSANVHNIESGFENTVKIYQELIVRHIHSKRLNEHILRFSGFYEAMARAYVRAHDPSAFSFDLETFDSLTGRAIKLYQVVAAKDGYVEKIEAEGRLRSLLAYIQKVKRST